MTRSSSLRAAAAALASPLGASAHRLLFAAALVAGLVACGSSGSPASTPPPDTTPPDPTTPPDGTPPPRGSYGAPELLWKEGGCLSWGCQTGWYASPGVANLDGDGALEVVWGSYDVVALDAATGTLRWRSAGGSRVWASPALVDLDGDGRLEVAVGRGGALTVLSGSGAVRWSATPFGGSEVRTLAVGDLHGGGARSLVVGRASGGATRQLAAYGASGALLAGWPARRDGEAGYGWGMYNQNVALGDLDGDGRAEVVGPTDTHYITVLDGDGDQRPASAIYGAGKVWSQVGVHVDQAVDLRGYAECGQEHRPNFADSAPLVATLAPGTAPAVVVVGNVYDCSKDPYQSIYQMPFLLRGDRTRWAGGGFDWTTLPSPVAGAAPRAEDYQVIESALPNPVVADLDGDGVKEILHPSYDGRLHALWLDRSEHGGWPFTVGGAGAVRFASEPAVADLDGDGRAEVIFASWPDKASGRAGRLHVVDSQGRLVHAVELPASSPAGSWNGGLGAPALARLAPGGDLHVFLGTAHSGVVAYRLPGTAAARVLWSTGRGSLARSGEAP